MANVTEYLEQLLKLTLRNMEILKGLNDAFHTNQLHLNVKVDNMNYTIPSFISLESQINNLNENFYNLVHAPETGEAYFDFNGNTRAIEVKSYQSTPNSLTLKDNINQFFTKENNSFEQLLFPNVYINLELDELPEDITSVVIKKITPINLELINFYKGQFKNNAAVSQYKYSDMFHVLEKYISGVDYKEYDDVVSMPIKNNIGTGTYVIEKIITDETSEALEQFITFKIRTDEDIAKSGKYMTTLKYKLFDEVKEEDLRIGDELTSYDGKTKLKIVGLDTINNEIRVLVANGEYLNLEGTGAPCDKIPESKITEVSKVKFFRQGNTNERPNKTLKLNLVDDNYVYIAVAPLNTRMNIRAPWGTGLFINPNSLKIIESNNEFKLTDYYNKNVKNIGTVLKEVSTLLYAPLSNINEDNFKTLSNIKPNLDEKNIHVVQINLHLKRDKLIKELIKLHKEKEEIKMDIERINNEIEAHKKTLSEISFDDVGGVRKNHEETIRSLEGLRNEAFTSITKIIQSIAQIADNKEIPLENAKYRIRGWFDYDKFAADDKLKNIISQNDVIGIKIRYRYRSSSKAQGNAVSMLNNFLFSDWNRLPNYIRPRHPEYIAGKGYNFATEMNTNLINLPSFNQIDIPINQGEVVDIKILVIYSFGYPFIETTSDWSNEITVKFPPELVDSTNVVNIIDMNNNDAENNKFVNLLQENGVPEHLQDKIVDQSITYFHKPEHIPSGFYTPERRIIPLKDKLSEMDDKLESLAAEINGDPAEDLNVTLNIGTTNYKLNPYLINNISVVPYSDFENKNDKEESKTNKIIMSNSAENNSIYKKYVAQGSYDFDNETGIASIIMYLNISSNMVLSSNKIPTVNGGSMLKLTTAKKPVKIYSMFPGDKSTILNDMKYSRFKLDDYAINENTSEEKNSNGVWMKIFNLNYDTNDMSLQFKAEQNKKSSNFKNPVQENLYHKSNSYKTLDVSSMSTPEISDWSVTSIESNLYAGFFSLLTADQFVTFRLNNITTGKPYYDYKRLTKGEEIFGINDLLSIDKNTISLPVNTRGAALYPYLNSIDSLKITGGSIYSYELLNGSHSLQIPLMFEYNLRDKTKKGGLFDSISKIISFDVRTSLYADPINYTVRITAKKELTKLDGILLKNSVDGLPKYNVSID